MAENPSCELKLDGTTLDLAGLAFALPKNSQWTSEVSKAIHKLNSQDMVDLILKKWTNGGCKIHDHPSALAYSMGLDEFGGFLFNTVMICLGCFLVLLLEIFVYKKITTSRQHFNFLKGAVPQKKQVWANGALDTSSTTVIFNRSTLRSGTNT